MKNFRCQRVADQITREIAKIIRQKIADPRLQMITITGARVTKDIRIAHIYFSCMETQTGITEIENSLTKAAGYLRRELGMALKMKFTPELHFHFDTSLEHGNKIWDKLSELHQNEPEDDEI